LLIVTVSCVTSRPAVPPSRAAALQWGVAVPVAIAPLSPASATVMPLPPPTPTPTRSNVVELAPSRSGSVTVAASACGDGSLARGGDAIVCVPAPPMPPAWTARALAANRNFILLMVTFSVTVGMSWALLTVLAQLMQPCGHSDTVVGVAGAVFLLAGVLPSLAIVPALQRWQAYLPLQRAALVTALVGTCLVLAVNQPGVPAGGMYAAYAAYGVLFMPLLPLTLEHAAEVTFPCPADTAAACLLSGANVVGAAFTFALTPLLELPVSAQCTSVVTPTAGVVIGSMAAAAIAGLPLVRDYRRRALEQGQ